MEFQACMVQVCPSSKSVWRWHCDEITTGRQTLTIGTVCRDLDRQVEALTQERDALQQRVTDFQAGVYGLPEASAEIAMLKEQLTAMDEEKAGARLCLHCIELNADRVTCRAYWVSDY